MRPSSPRPTPVRKFSTRSGLRLTSTHPVRQVSGLSRSVGHRLCLSRRSGGQRSVDHDPESPGVSLGHLKSPSSATTSTVRGEAPVEAHRSRRAASFRTLLAAAAGVDAVARTDLLCHLVPDVVLARFIPVLVAMHRPWRLVRPGQLGRLLRSGHRMAARLRRLPRGARGTVRRRPGNLIGGVPGQRRGRCESWREGRIFLTGGPRAAGRPGRAQTDRGHHPRPQGQRHGSPQERPDQI
jgi:hypothetical protein